MSYFVIKEAKKNIYHPFKSDKLLIRKGQTFRVDSVDSEHKYCFIRYHSIVDGKEYNDIAFYDDVEYKKEEEK